MPDNHWAIYDLIDAKVRKAPPATIATVCLGINWTVASLKQDGIDSTCGLCFSPTDAPRTLPWPGTLAGKGSAEVLPWLTSWNPCEAAVATAVANAAINGDSPLLARTQPLTNNAPPHLRVFEHFFSGICSGNIVVIGHYPGMERYRDRNNSSLQITCLERCPQPGDLPDTAAEYLLPQADWVFISASSLANKTLPRMLQLSANATTVLMGPSLPWLEEWRDYGVDYLAGVAIENPAALMAVAMEGGGTRIFDMGVSYRVCALG